MNQIRLYGKNRKNAKNGKKSYWTDIEEWRRKRFEETGKYPVKVNVSSKSSEGWAKGLSPLRLGPVETYVENGVMLRAGSVEVAWQYSKIYTYRKMGNNFLKLNFSNSDGTPNSQWFEWRNQAWSNPCFDWNHAEFDKNKKMVRRAYEKGSKYDYFYWDGRIYNQVEARQVIYANLYCREVVKTDGFKRLQELFQENDLVLFEFDGYDYVELGMTPRQTLEDLDHSWGHGMLLTLMLQGIDPRTI